MSTGQNLLTLCGWGV